MYVTKTKKGGLQGLPDLQLHMLAIDSLHELLMKLLIVLKTRGFETSAVSMRIWPKYYLKIFSDIFDSTDIEMTRDKCHV